MQHSVAVVAPGFESVAEYFEQGVAQDPGLSAQLTVYVGGAPVLDLAAGELKAGEMLRTDALHAVFSVSKGLGSLVVARLVQDGLLDPALPVAEYWPEFAAAGKERVTVDQLLSHQAGLLGPAGGLAMEDILGSRPAAAVLASLAPQWTPGVAFGYHALSFGTLLEELVLRVSGHRAQELYEEWFRAPSGAEAWLGLPAEERPRYVDVPSTGGQEFVDPLGLDGLAVNSTAGFVTPRGERSFELLGVPNHPLVQQAGPVALGGVATAHGLARVYAAAATGLVRADGTRSEPLLRAETLAEVTRDRVYGLDRIGGTLKAFGLGFMRPHPQNDFGSASAFGHDGANGTVSFADPSWGVAFGYLPFSPRPGSNGSLPQRVSVQLRKALMALAG